MCTLPETNSHFAPEIGRIPKENDRIPTIHFQVLCFQGGYCLVEPGTCTMFIACNQKTMGDSIAKNALLEACVIQNNLFPYATCSSIGVPFQPQKRHKPSTQIHLNPANHTSGEWVISGMSQ